MSLGLEFNISAKDQASAAVETVNKKIKDFGKDVAKSFLSFAAPLTLLQTGISFVGDKIEEYNQKVKEATEGAAKLKDEAADIGVSVEVWQRLKGAADESGIAVSKVGKLYNEAVRLIEQGKDPLSDASRILRDALGFASEDVAKGNLQAIDVIERMGKAISGATSETDAMNLATALLGETMAKELLPALREAAKLKEGYVDTEGLTEEEAQVLREAKAEERRTKAREEYNTAAQAAAQRFLETDEEAGKIGVQFGQIRAGFEGSQAARDTMRSKAGFMSEDPAVQAAIRKLLRDRVAAAKEASKAETDAAAASVRASAVAKDQAEYEAFIAEFLAEQEAESAKDNAKEQTEADKAAQKAADEKAKKDKKDLADALDADEKLKKENASGTGKLTVSSLREIGGGLAGESILSGLDIQQKQLDISQSILIELQKLNVKTLPEAPTSIDFTKGGINQTTFNA
jgi:hypothetical protein